VNNIGFQPRRWGFCVWRYQRLRRLLCGNGSAFPNGMTYKSSRLRLAIYGTDNFQSYTLFDAEG
jgi:hypothetical protein